MRLTRPWRGAPPAPGAFASVVALLAALFVAASPGSGLAQAPAKLLIQSVCILGTDQEYVSI